MKNIVVSTIFMIICSALVVGAGIAHREYEAGLPETADSDADAASDPSDDVISVWYCDSELDDYLAALSQTYADEKNITIELTYCAQSEMLEEINAANIDDDLRNADVYFISTESLEKAYLSGLAAEIDDADTFNSESFSETAISACTYHGKLIAYPFCFETSMLAYNTDYVDEAPRTFDEILDAAGDEETELGGDVTYVMKWDVNSLQYNFAFAGSYLEYGGQDGDDESILDLNSDEVVLAMEYYYSLSDFFSIDPDDAEYDDVLADFASGEIVYTIINTKSIKTLDSSGISYEVCVLPDMSDELETAVLSLTTAAVINPYAENEDAAAELVDHICFEGAGDVYEHGGSLPCAGSELTSSGKLSEAMKAYDESVSLPKLMSAGDYWVYLEIALNEVWSGQDINETMNTLEEKVR